MIGGVQLLGLRLTDTVCQLTPRSLKIVFNTCSADYLVFGCFLSRNDRFASGLILVKVNTSSIAEQAVRRIEITSHVPQPQPFRHTHSLLVL